MPLPNDAKGRKAVPLHSGLVAYFKDALIEVARLSQIGNDQHNPGQPLHWSKDKSNDHEDCLLRHHFEAGTIDSDGVRHSAKRAWRSLAALQLEIELVEANQIDLGPADDTHIEVHTFSAAAAAGLTVELASFDEDDVAVEQGSDWGKAYQDYEDIRE